MAKAMQKERTNSIEFIKSQSLKTQDMAGALISPDTRISVGPNKTVSEFFYNKHTNNALPSKEDIMRLTNTFLSSKKKNPEFSAESYDPLSTKNSFKLPQITLRKAIQGVNTTGKWFESKEKEPADEIGASRYQARPKNMFETANRMFPTKNIEFSKYPQTNSSRFSLLNPKEDTELADYLVKADNAFKTHWNKSNQLKDRRFYPETHPEFIREEEKYNRKRDRIVEYREAMLKVEDMMKKKNR